jgi:hypothetical protein
LRTGENLLGDQPVLDKPARLVKSVIGHMSRAE